MEIKEILDKQYETEDILAVVQHHDGITGTEAEYVTMDYSTNLAKAFTKSKKLYSDLIE